MSDLEITATAGPMTATLTVADHETDAESGLVSPRWIAYVAGSSLVSPEQAVGYNADDGLDSWTSEDESAHESLEAAIRIAIVDAWRALWTEQRAVEDRVRRGIGATPEMRRYIERLEWQRRDVEHVMAPTKVVANDRSNREMAAVYAQAAE